MNVSERVTRSNEARDQMKRKSEASSSTDNQGLALYIYIYIIIIIFFFFFKVKRLTGHLANFPYRLGLWALSVHRVDRTAYRLIYPGIVIASTRSDRKRGREGGEGEPEHIEPR